MINKIFFLILFNCIVLAMHAQTKDTTWSKSYKGLSIGITGTSEKDIVVFLKNTAQKETIEVWNYVQFISEQEGLDWYNLELINIKGQKYHLHLEYLISSSSDWVSKSLKPRQILSHKIDLVYWWNKGINGTLVDDNGNLYRASLKGKYQIYITYKVDDNTKKWQGKIQAGPHIIEIK